MKKINLIIVGSVFGLIVIISLVVFLFLNRPLEKKYKKDIDYSSESLYSLSEEIVIKEIIIYETKKQTYIYAVYSYDDYKTGKTEENYQVFFTETGQYLSGGIVESLNPNLFKEFSEEKLKAEKVQNVSDKYIKYLNDILSVKVRT
ncbi:hypothetical protein [Haploplasma axanthum]|uniref:Uncharacterized protein n=1 Tax=Haploplasma axanthum TaxID=29552 RepID=A0A449BCH3_HAPAX|nr:hypothetical protein [Haploplasma axanthum]VEU80151.1 Uncharacterised protein [Haploplasma axanthum]